ncbi:MAG: MFS transporter [Candidatus Bathyarchaeia archaeon]
MASSKRSASKSIFLNLGLFQLLSFVRRGIFYTFMINYIYDLMGTVTFTALLGTLDMVASALGQNLLWGKISDKHKLRAKLIIAGESIAAGTYLLVYFVHRSLLNFQAFFTAGALLIIGLSMLEFFWSMSDVGWAALLADVTTSKTRGKIIGSLNFIASLGRMIGINFAGLLYQNGEGFRQGTLFYIVTAMLTTSAFLMWVVSRQTEKALPKIEKNSASEATLKRKASKHDSKTYMWFLATLVIIIIGVACINQIFLLFIRLPDGLKANDQEASFILTMWTVGGMLASLFSGVLADRIGRAKTLFIGLLLAIVTPLAYGVASNVFTIAVFYGLNGASFWTIQTVGFSFAADLIPEDRRGRLFSVYNTVIALSWGPAGLLVGGPIADIQTHFFGFSSRNAYVNAFYVSSIIVTAGTLLFLVKVAKRRTRMA